MSFQVTTAFVQQYSANVALLSQQHGSVLENAVMRDNTVVGYQAYYDQVGPTTYLKNPVRHSDSPLFNTPHARRQVALYDVEWGDLVDKLDKVMMLIDPTSTYAMNAGLSMGRAKDDAIVAGFFATANTGQAGGTAVTFPAGNVIAVNDRTFQDQGNTGSGNSSLTVSKMISARNIFFTGNVQETEEFFCAPSAQQMSALLTATPVTNIWYTEVKALVQGLVKYFMGTNIIRTQLVIQDGLGNSLLDGSGYANVPMWAKSGMMLAIGQEPKADIAPRPDKRFSTYVYYSMALGTTRMEEVKVVQLKCDPTKTN